MVVIDVIIRIIADIICSYPLMPVIISEIVLLVIISRDKKTILLP